MSKIKLKSLNGTFIGIEEVVHKINMRIADNINYVGYVLPNIKYIDRDLRFAKILVIPSPNLYRVRYEITINKRDEIGSTKVIIITTMNYVVFLEYMENIFYYDD